MCTWIIEKTSVAGSGKGAQGWFPVVQANVSYDHPVHAQLEHAVLIDFVNPTLGPGARVAIELDVPSARELIRTLQATVAVAQTVDAP
jgi:hypothetical protein